MVSSSSRIEAALRANELDELKGVLPSGEFILPHYSAYSIGGLPSTIARIFGAELDGALPPIAPETWLDLADGVTRVLLVVLDGVGYAHFRSTAMEEVLQGIRTAEMRLVPLTSVFPPTTMAAMSTLWTGRAPVSHGFVGSRLLLSDLGVMANMVLLSPAAHRQPGQLLKWGWKPEEFITAPSLAEQLAAGGVRTHVHLNQGYVKGGLNRVFLRGVLGVDGYIGLGDLWPNVSKTLVDAPLDGLFVHVYWNGTDDVAHKYGPDSAQFRGALRHVGRSLAHFLNGLPAMTKEGTLLVVTADHGQVRTPAEDRVRLLDHPDLREMLLLPPAGEPRAAYLYVRPGYGEAVQDYVYARLSDRFVVVESERALAAGLFGPGEPVAAVRQRIGDLVLLSRGRTMLVSKGWTERCGHHGSLTPDEMLVPLLLARLDV